MIIPGCVLDAQVANRDILERDVFPGNVKTFLLEGTAVGINPIGDTTGKIYRRHEKRVWHDSSSFESTTTFSGATWSDSIWYNPARSRRFYLHVASNNTSRYAEKLNDRGEVTKRFENGKLYKNVKFNSQGKISRTIWKERFFRRGILRCSYDEAGRLVHTYYRCIECDFSSSERYYSYDSKNNTKTIISITYYDDARFAADTTRIVYNDLGQEISLTVSFKGGKSRQTSYVYNSSGLVVEKRNIYLSNEAVIQEIEERIWYDEMNYFSKVVTVEAGVSKETTWMTTYNEYGLPVTCEFNENGRLENYRWTYTYW